VVLPDGTRKWKDWTNGCIAVTNAEMDEIWGMVKNGTPIQIHP
jgi:L,D-peptidoglycan transpeptidase YkuD (ErfK/YbiS/YcfS/YnhG family)